MKSIGSRVYQKTNSLKSASDLLMNALVSDKGIDDYLSLEILPIGTSDTSNRDFVSFLQNTHHVLM